MKKTFNRLPWHDAELLNIGIDRSDPGNNDEVHLLICWPKGNKSELIFHDCYALEARLNFGIIAEETVRDAICLDSSEQINEIRDKWKKLGSELKELKQFQIKTNSTNSQIIIYSYGYRIIDL